MKPEARIAAAIDLLDLMETAIRTGGPPADRIAQRFFRDRRYIGSKDRAAIHERVYAALRRRGRLTWALSAADPEGPVDGRRLTLAHLVRDEGQSLRALKKIFGAGGHAPDALRMQEDDLVEGLKTLRSADAPDWARNEHPEWMTDALRTAFAEDYVAETAALRQPAEVALRVNTLKTDRDAAAAALAEAGVATTPCAHAPFGLRVEGRPNIAASAPFRDGWVELQDEASQIAAALCDARPGLSVLDLCAGALGKSLAFAAAMENRGRLLSCDVDRGRLEAGARRRKRAGVDCLQTRVVGERGDAWLSRQAGRFDRVFIDAPCTGTGAWRRNPDQRWRLDAAAPDRLAALQGDLLARGAALVKPGGRLIYATCSILPAENDAPVDAFLAARPEFTPLRVDALWPQVAPTPQPPGMTDRFRATPARNGSDGFFCAVLERGLNAAAA